MEIQHDEKYDEQVPSEIIQLRDEFTTAQQEVADELNSLITNGTLTQKLESIQDPLEKAQLLVSLTYALNSLTFTYLKTQDESTSDHPIKKELDRTKLYFQRLQEVKKKRDAANAASSSSSSASSSSSSSTANDRSSSTASTPQGKHTVWTEDGMEVEKSSNKSSQSQSKQKNQKSSGKKRSKSRSKGKK
eukprot:TRINITY_DN365_c0_g1_i1.p1 TRINITY_DN365_c0_g1~~TRINITY_DN365_c0_g1_i1.p1  ORF type:complete len:197 (-),score=66.62 TRINITY_DN365_c0_g1_i1:349-918(-)